MIDTSRDENTNASSSSSLQACRANLKGLIQSLSTPVSPLPSPTLFFIAQDVQEVCIYPSKLSLRSQWGPIDQLSWRCPRHSALQKSAVRASRSAFRPAVSTGLRAASARFASDSALHGKIHQVIGAVVDGEWLNFFEKPKELRMAWKMDTKLEIWR